MTQPSQHQSSQRQLSPRLQCLLEMLESCELFADVGTDHGLLPIAAVLSGRAQQALACDLREEPLLLAERNIKKAKASNRVTALRGDGLSNLGDLRPDAVSMAGMTGGLMRRICEQSPEVLQRVQQLLCQPNGQVETMRAWAYSSGFHLHHEEMLRINGRFFVSCHFKRGPGADPAYKNFSPQLPKPADSSHAKTSTEEDSHADEATPRFSLSEAFELGPLLLSQRHEVAHDYYQEQKTRLGALLASGARHHEHSADLYARACRLFL